MSVFSAFQINRKLRALVPERNLMRVPDEGRWPKKSVAVGFG